MRSLLRVSSKICKHILNSEEVEILLQLFSKYVVVFLHCIITVIIVMFWETFGRIIVFIYINGIALKKSLR